MTKVTKVEKLSIALLLIAICIVGCGGDSHQYRIVTGSATYDYIGRIVAEHVGNDLGVDIATEFGTGEGSNTNRNLIIDRKIDFAIVQNDTEAHPDLRSVPVSSSVPHRPGCRVVPRAAIPGAALNVCGPNR